MYTTSPCSEPNSQSPISPQAIAAEQASLAAVAQVMEQGNQTLDNLITALGGNPAGIGSGSVGAQGGGSGVATGSTLVPNPGAPGYVWGNPHNPLGSVWAPPPDTGMFPKGAPYYSWGGSQNGGGFKTCLIPEVLPLLTVFPVPPSPTVIQPAPINPPQPPPPVPECAVNADTICSAIRDGCVLSSQVSSAQLFACSQAGWVGNRNLYPALAARGGAQGGKYFGDLNLSPEAPPAAAAGLSGLGDWASWFAPLGFTYADYVAPAAAPAGVSLQSLCVTLPGGANSCDTITPSWATSLNVPLWAAGLAAVAIAMTVFGGKKGRRG